MDYSHSITGTANYKPLVPFTGRGWDIVAVLAGIAQMAVLYLIILM